ncbi:MAG: efflux RND transporter permease subunit [Flavipsychrobacter sp.]
MWHRIAAFVIKYRITLLVILLVATAFMGYKATSLQLSYNFAKTIPTDNPKYTDYQEFRKKYGEDGNLMVVGVQTERFYTKEFFSSYRKLVERLQKVEGVENVISIPGAINLVKDTTTNKLVAGLIVEQGVDVDVDSFRKVFENLPFYKGFLYNPSTNSYLLGIRVNKDILNSKHREAMVREMVGICDKYGEEQSVEVHYSGLPLIRSVMATGVKDELNMFLMISFLLTAVILILFFRSITAVIASMLVVAMGVIWSMGITAMFGYKITLLTGLIPPLVVVIGIPNCVYFLNKYHSEYSLFPNKAKALLRMVDRMGIVTLFTNLTTAIGFGVFAFTHSSLLKEFGKVASINIVVIFIISLIFIPSFYSFLPPPKGRHTSYLQNKLVNKLLQRITSWVFSHRPWIYAAAIIVCVLSVLGMTRLRNVGFIVDDLPKEKKIYQDLKFFERNFKGVMPLEILIDTKRKNGATSLSTLKKVDQFTNYLNKYPEIGSKLSIVEGVKFARQAYYNGDSNYYAVPNAFDASFIQPYLRMKSDNGSLFGSLVNSFIDSNRQEVRISLSIADVGSERLPILLDSIQPVAYKIFDTSKYKVTFTGTSVVYQEGSRFIINSLRNSLILAFVMIFGCMIFLFRSWRMLFISLVIDIIPLMITAGLMGWADIAIKPSTVLIFSVALGITIDVTIRFLVNFRQEMDKNGNDIPSAVDKTIADTGLSIIYTTLILVAGFGVFILSDFDGTKSLGYLTSLTLLLAMVTNLILQPALLLWMDKILKKNKSPKWLKEEQGDEKEA